MASMVRKWLHARVVLGLALVWHLLRAPWRGAKDAARWLGAMRREGLGATDPVQWKQAEKASRCVGCGLCDQFATDALPHPSFAMLGAVRLQADALELAAQAPALRTLDADIASVCPTGASAAAVADVLEGHARSLRRLTEPGA